MNEHAVTQRLMARMRERGFLVRKIAGTLYSSGMPDFYACRSHRTIFFEVKLVKVSHFQTLDRGKCPLTVTPQLVSMEEHELKSQAWYLVYLETTTGDQMLLQLLPSEVREWIVSGPEWFCKSVDSRDPMSTQLLKEKEWLENYLPELFPRRDPSQKN